MTARAETEIDELDADLRDLLRRLPGSIYPRHPDRARRLIAAIRPLLRRPVFVFKPLLTNDRWELGEEGRTSIHQSALSGLWPACLAIRGHRDGSVVLASVFAAPDAKYAGNSVRDAIRIDAANWLDRVGHPDLANALRRISVHGGVVVYTPRLHDPTIRTE